MSSSAASRRRNGSTKRDIAAGAAELFAERGFPAVSVQDIGERVGITGGAIYRHYPSKDAVLHAVMLDIIDRWNGVAQGADGDIERLVEVSLQLVVDHPGLLATYLRERRRVEPALQHELADRERQLFRQWAVALLAHRPDLTRRDVAVRQQAINGVLSSLAQRPALLSQARTRAAIAAGLVAVAATPTAATTAGRASARPSWVAPVPRREQIIATAMRLFAEHGFHGVSMDDIGREVGMAGPSLYEHVAGKGDILLDAYDRAGAYVVAGAADAVSGAGSAGDALDRLLSSYVEVAFDHVDLLVVTSREGSALPAAERPRLARRRRDLHELWSGVLRELRPDLSPGDGRVLVRCSLALLNALARQRRGTSPGAREVIALGRAFLLSQPSTTIQEQP